MSELSDARAESLTAIKFIELTIAIACTVLHYYSYNDGDLVTAFLATGSFCGFIVVLGAVFTGYLIKARIHKRLDMLLSLIGCGMFISSGILIIQAWNDAFRTRTRDLAILKGSISILNGALFLYDCVFTFKQK